MGYVQIPYMLRHNRKALIVWENMASGTGACSMHGQFRIDPHQSDVKNMSNINIMVNENVLSVLLNNKK